MAAGAPVATRGDRIATWEISETGAVVTVRDPAFSTGPFPLVVDLPTGAIHDNSLRILSLDHGSPWPEFILKKIGVAEFSLTLLEPCAGYLYKTRYVDAQSRVTVILPMPESGSTSASIIASASLTCNAAFPVAHLPSGCDNVFVRFNRGIGNPERAAAAHPWVLSCKNFVAGATTNIQLTALHDVPFRRLTGIIYYKGTVLDYIVVEPPDPAPCANQFRGIIHACFKDCELLPGFCYHEPAGTKLGAILVPLGYPTVKRIQEVVPAREPGGTHTLDIRFADSSSNDESAPGVVVMDIDNPMISDGDGRMRPAKRVFIAGRPCVDVPRLSSGSTIVEFTPINQSSNRLLSDS